jgi:hypothetical protein
VTHKACSSQGRVGEAVAYLLHRLTGSRAGPAPGDVNPFSQARTLLPFNVNNVRVAATPAANAILLLRVPLVPVLVLLDALLLV